MKNKKILILLILVLILIISSLFFIVKKFNSKNNQNTQENVLDYTPQEEIDLKALRQTNINLYFVENETGNLKYESRLIDSAELVSNPYRKIVELLLQGPSNTNLSSPFPENISILDVFILNHCVTIDFSDDLLMFKDENQKLNIVNSLLNSLTELNEVKSIKILINNETHDEFKEEYANALQ